MCLFKVELTIDKVTGQTFLKNKRPILLDMQDLYFLSWQKKVMEDRNLNVSNFLNFFSGDL